MSKSRVIFVQALPMPRTGAMQLSAVLKQAGHSCEVIVTSLERDPIRAILEREPNLVALSCTTGEHRPASDFATRLMEASPDLPIVMGGPHPTCWPDVVRLPALDAICRGEGEGAIVDLADCVANGADNHLADCQGIPNVTVKVGGEICQTPPRTLLADLDALPFPDYDLYERYPACDYIHVYPMVLTGRGCPYGCSFCINQYLREFYDASPKCYVRRKSVAKVLAEIGLLKKRYSIKTVEFVDDTFTLNKPWLEEFLPAYAARIGVPFVCDIRADTLDEDLLRIMKDARCQAVRMSVESGSEHMRNRLLKKGLREETIRTAAEMLHAAGIRLLTYNIVGSPGESLDDAMATLQFNRELSPDYAMCTLLQPYPGTPVREYAKEHGYLAADSGMEDFPVSLFTRSLFANPERKELENLQRIFDPLSRLRLPESIVRRVVKACPTSVAHVIFKLSYVHYLRTIEGIHMTDILRAGIASHRKYTGM